MSVVAERIARVDERLAAWADEAATVCPDARSIEMLRHVAGRRLTASVTLSTGPATLKVYANPRARGNGRRLHLLAASPAAAVVPRVLAVGTSGHVLLLEHVPGRTINTVTFDEVPSLARAAGVALRIVHESATRLDRTWGIDDERAQLRRSAGRRTSALVEAVLADVGRIDRLPFVPSHRDCHPAQAVAVADGTVRWIDLDDASMAPAGLDVGNFLAHITREGVLGRWPADICSEARRAFRSGYGVIPPSTPAWERLSLARLAGLADTRHDDSDELGRIEMLLAASS